MLNINAREVLILAEYPIIMKQKNDQGDYDTLYPKTLGSQIEGNISSSQVEGTIPSSQISGTFPSTSITGQFPASQIDDIYTKDQTLTQATAALFGLGADSVPDDGFAWIGKYNQHWWRRGTKGKVTGKGTNAAPLSVVQLNGINDSYEISYSDKTKVNQNTNEIQLVDPQKVSVSFNTASNAKVLKGKYFKTYTVNTGLSDGFYYVDTDAPDPESEAGNYYSVIFYSKAYNVTVVDGVGPWEYVQSSDRHAYPDSGEQDGYEYQYLGVPFKNAVGAPKIETGSYVGTGTYGSSNPNSLTFGFKPKIFVPVGSTETNPDKINAYSILATVPVYALTNSYQAVALGNTGNSGYYNLMRVDGTTLYWYYNNNDAGYQLNRAGVTYYYLVIG